MSDMEKCGESMNLKEKSTCIDDVTCKEDATSQDYTIRDVRIEEAARLAEIYSYYVLKTAVSFEYEAPTAPEFEKRIRKISEHFPYLVCEKDGIVAGYVYASPYSTRAAYAWTATTSIYVDPDRRREGIGRRLYEALEARLKAQGIVHLLAGVAFSEVEDEYLTQDSIRFHTKEGYEKVAHMKKIGKKFDRWYDLIWMQKDLV